MYVHKKFPIAEYYYAIPRLEYISIKTGEYIDEMRESKKYARYYVGKLSAKARKSMAIS